MTRVAVVAHAINGFQGEIHQSPEELISSITIDLLDDLGLEREDIDATMLSDQDAFDGTAISSGIKVTPAGGLDKPMNRVQNCCGFGIHQARSTIQAGKADLITMVGADTIEADPAGVSHISSEAVNDRDVGANHLVTGGILANHHLSKTGLTPENLAEVAARNYEQAADVPHAHRTDGHSTAEVLESDPIAEPLRELMMSPMSFGAAIMFLASEDVAEQLDVDPIWITATGAGSERYDYRDMDEHLEQASLETATEEAYAEAGIEDPQADIDIVETFSPNPSHEILTFETLGLCDRSNAFEFASKPRDEGRDVELHPSGGAIATNPHNTGGIFRAIVAAQALKGEVETAVDDPQRAVVADNDRFLGDKGVSDAVLVFEREVAT